MEKSFAYHIKKMLLLCKEVISKNPTLVQTTGKINVKGDHQIGMDIKIEEALINYVTKQKIPVAIFSEEAGALSIAKNPKYLFVFDPLDGSTNYRIGKNLLPFGTLLCFYQGLKPKLKNILAAGALEFTQNLAWVYDGKETKDLKGQKIKLKNNWPANCHTPVYLDLYYRQNYQTYFPLAEQIYVRNTGSTIGNLSYLLSNVSSGLGHARMRPEEIGAIYALIKGAGGIAVDHNGKDLGEKLFDPEEKYPILAGCKNIINFCVKKINK